MSWVVAACGRIIGGVLCSRRERARFFSKNLRARKLVVGKRRAAVVRYASSAVSCRDFRYSSIGKSGLASSRRIFRVSS